MSRLYVSGPMTGIEEFNYPVFRQVTAQLRAAGHTVIDPSETDGGTERTWEEYLREDIVDVMSVEGLALLPGWQRSRGARLEVFVAGEVGIPSQPWEQWLAP